MRIARHVRRLEGYVPGEQPKSRNVVKLNTNENPYPPSPACAKVLESFDLDRLRRYPDPDCTELRVALARLNGTKPENIFIGNGSDEVLAIAARCFVEDDESIGSLDPSYSLYKTLAAIRNVKWVGVEIARQRAGDASDKRDERSDVLRNASPLASRVSDMPASASLFLLTNPNAPTGEFREPGEIAAFARAFRGVVLIDEAYADFARANCMALATSPKNRNILVMRTFSKSYSLAGLRVGYCVGPTDLIAAMYKVKDSYNVDAIAQAVALAAIKDQAWMKANAAKIVETRKDVTAELEKRGWDVLPSESNFVFAKPPEKKVEKIGGQTETVWLREESGGVEVDLLAGGGQRNAEKIFNALREKNIFVRYFKGPKTGERLRITIGTPAQMKKLLAALDEIPT